MNRRTVRVVVLLFSSVLMFGLLGLVGLRSCAVAKVPTKIGRAWQAYVANYPWVTEPIDTEHQRRLCEALGLSNKTPFCSEGGEPRVLDLLEVLENRLPVNKTPYDQVAEALQGFPSVKQESVSPDGTVTSRAYTYKLTQFPNFCVTFGVDMDTNLVVRIFGTKAPGLFDGPIPVRPCVPSSE